LVCAALVCVALGCAALGACGTAGFEQRERGPAVKKKDRAQGRASTEENRAGGYGEPELLARLDDRTLDESSGLAASRANPGVVWTHNDSGPPLVYAFDTGGRARGVWRVAGARLYDWEDVALGPGPEAGRSYLYVADIGDNRRGRREVTIYRFPEPQVTAAAARSDARRPLATEPAEAIRLRYSDGAHDAEAFMVHPRSGDLYVVTKVALRPAVVYRLAAPHKSGAVGTLERVGEFLPPTLAGGLITGGDISPDGRRVVLCDYAGGYEFRLPTGERAFDAIWRQAATKFTLGERGQGESVAYFADASSVLATSEGASPPLFRVTIPR
jgi:hypothetical protein